MIFIYLLGVFMTALNLVNFSITYQTGFGLIDVLAIIFWPITYIVIAILVIFYLLQALILGPP